MGLRDTFLNMLGGETHEVQKTDNSVYKSARDFLRYGNREKLFPDWSEVKMPDSDMYRGYSYAVIQKRSNKVATLAKNNLSTWANPDVVDEYQKKDQTVLHPYLKLIEDSTEFSEKQFWKNISIYLDLAGRYYLGVIRNQIVPTNPNLPTITTDPTKFVLLNPYEIRRVIDKNKNVAGYIERKKDGRYREWPLYQIIEMRELNPFDPENSQWAMTDAAKEAVYTMNQSGDYTRQSLHGNIEAPGIITTDVLLPDEDFRNFRERVTQHTKGEPLFGNGTGAIKWDAMQVDLDRAALMDINEINRTTLFAVSGTSKTSLGIEQSGTTRETARVQSEQFVSDTAQPRLEDIIDFLNLDYKKNYFNEYKKTGYYIEVKSAVGRDYDTEQKATALKQSQFQLAMTLIQSGYTQESAWQFAEDEIDYGDLELEKGLDKPINPEQPEEPETPTENGPTKPQNGPQNGSGNKDDKGITDETKDGENANNSLELDLIPNSDLFENGGPGSGNFGHAGREGKRGGSARGSSGSVADIKKEIRKAQEDVAGITSLRELVKESEKATESTRKAIKTFEGLLGQGYGDDLIKKRIEEHKSLLKSLEASVEGNKKRLEDALKEFDKRHENSLEGENSLPFQANGGPGSGNFGHAGREGKRGGSGKGGKVYHRKYSSDGKNVVAEWDEVRHPIYPDEMIIKSDDQIGMVSDASAEFGISKKAFDVRDKRLKNPFEVYEPIDAQEEELVKEYIKESFGIDDDELGRKLGKTTNSMESEETACTCHHDHKVETFFNQVSETESKEVKEAYNEFLTEIRALEKETIDAAARKLTVNAFDESDIIGKRKKASIVAKMKNAVKKYWYFLMPLFAGNNMNKRNAEFKQNIVFTFDNALQNKVIANAERVAEGHIDTILNDVLEASNKVYTDILEDAAADLIVKAYREDPSKFGEYFDKEPTVAEALSSVKRTDILEVNRRIYERANKLAFEGYSRGKIIRAIRAEYKDISEKRATLIAGNETARAFGRSQFESDVQFLNSIGKMGQAYKVWYSRRPANEQDKICTFCRTLIEQSNANPVPFEKPFVSYGESIEVVEDGKLKIFTANYEDIEGGTLHPNCACGYKLVFKNADGTFSKTLNGGSGSGNFGHSGRPGEVGGSGNGSGLARLTTSEWSEKMNRGELRESVSLLDETNFDYVIVPRLERMDIINEGEGISEENTKKNLDRMTSEEREALVNYTSEYNAGNSSEVNHYLRTGEGNESTKKAAELVSSALDKCSLGEDTVCFRGVEPKVLGPEAEKLGKQIRSAVKNGSSKQFKSMEQRLASLKGMEIQDKGCLSTSKFYDSKYSNLGMTMVIRAKKNDKACDIHSLSRYGQNRDQYSTMLGYSPSTMETEVLFAPNTKLKVKDAKLTDKGILVECETISDKTKNSLSGVELNGGKGSGNFGHAGRIGEVGGSSRNRVEGFIYGALPDYDMQPTDGYTILYTNTSAENLDSIDKGGLKIGKRLEGYKESPEEGMAIWTDSNNPGSTGYGGSTVAFQIPTEEAKRYKVNDTQHIVPHDIARKDILFIDRGLWEGVKVSRLPKLVSEYGKDKVLDVAEKHGYDKDTIGKVISLYENKKTTNGGPGSGNFGHAGREGEVGGSAKTNYTSGEDLFNAKMNDKLDAFRDLSPEEQAVFCEKAMEMDYKDMPQDLADTDFQRISYALGIKDSPKTVGDKEFGEAIQNGEEEFFRAVKGNGSLTPTQVAERLYTGEYTYQGNGDYCDGTYFTPDWGAMEYYMGKSVDTSDTAVIRCSVSLDANIYYSGPREPFDAKMASVMNTLEQKTGMKQNTARAVALLGAGYDGWSFVSGGVNKEYLCMLNRKHLTVNKENFLAIKSEYEGGNDVE